MKRREGDREEETIAKLVSERETDSRSGIGESAKCGRDSNSKDSWRGDEFWSKE